MFRSESVPLPVTDGERSGNVTSVPSPAVRKFVLLCVVLCSMIAFAVEPTTSTEYDIQEGRAHGAYVTVGASVVRAVSTTVSGTPVVPAMLTALAALLAVVFATHALGVVATADGRDRSALRWATAARRGPPARG